MENNTIQTNKIKLSGKIITEPQPSHQVYGENFYGFMLDCVRLSQASDILPVTISDRLLIHNKIEVGNYVNIEGQIRSYNSYSEGKTHLILTVFVKNIEICDKLEGNNPNDVYLNGYICKEPIYRTTPFGREIADVLLAVNRAYSKSDYIPIICWGRNARFVSSLDIGSNIIVNGRMQSRVYQKKIDDETILEKTAYEVSVSKVEYIEG
ncbi:MAG: single-stranded DNA-binding protein [Lachnospirales bacterium]